MKKVYKLYVGLSRIDTPQPIDEAAVIDWFAKRTESFTTQTAQGYFRGQREGVIVLTLAHESYSFVEDLARQLRIFLEQDGIGLEYDGAYHRVTAENDQ